MHAWMALIGHYIGGSGGIDQWLDGLPPDRISPEHLDPRKIFRYACVDGTYRDVTLVAAWWGVSHWGSVSGATPNEGGVLLRTSVFKSSLDLLG